MTLITKVKYIALDYAIKGAVRIEKFINKLGLNAATIKSVILQGNNKISIALTKNAKISTK